MEYVRKYLKLVLRTRFISLPTDLSSGIANKPLAGTAIP